MRFTHTYTHDNLTFVILFVFSKISRLFYIKYPNSKSISSQNIFPIDRFLSDNKIDVQYIMGGCRCTFRNCENSTQNNPSMHFFHFPFRDLPRCEKWAEYSNNLAFLQLPINQLRNKVVCETHFKEQCFMNIKRERLTKFAIPTLLRTKNGEVVDFEIDQSNPTIYDVQTTKTSKYYEPPTYKPIKLLNSKAGSKVQSASVLRDEDNSVADTLVDASFDYSEIDQEDDMNDSVEITEQAMESEAGEPTLLNGITLTKIEINRFDPECDSDAAPTYTKLKRKVPPMAKSKVQNEHLSGKDSLAKQVNYDDENIEFYDYAPKRSKNADSVSADVKVIRQKPDNSVDKTLFVEAMDKQIKELVDLKQIITQKMDKLEDLQNQSVQTLKTTPTVINAQEKPRSSIEAGPTKTKIQLFNGIKKYLNPSMVALLRMEMFGDTERLYKSDEKSLAVELLNVQTNIYEYMRSELRKYTDNLPSVSNSQILKIFETFVCLQKKKVSVYRRRRMPKVGRKR